MSLLSLINKPLLSTALSTTLFISLSQSAYADDGPPGTDIYVADISQTSSGSYQLGTPEQITRRHGYDNQPFFVPSGSLPIASGLLYTGILQQQDGVYQADSFAYDFATKQHTNLTNSQLSEYSPTLMPFKINNQAAFSAIVVEDVTGGAVVAVAMVAQAKIIIATMVAGPPTATLAVAVVTSIVVLCKSS